LKGLAHGWDFRIEKRVQSGFLLRRERRAGGGEHLPQLDQAIDGRGIGDGPTSRRPASRGSAAPGRRGNVEQSADIHAKSEIDILREHRPRQQNGGDYQTDCLHALLQN
jgi:hypothetical protein